MLPRRRVIDDRPGTPSVRATRKRNELSSMSIQSVNTDQLLTDADDETGRRPTPRSQSRAATSRSPTTSASMSQQKLARLERFDRTHLPLRCRARARAQPPPAQELSARRDHRARPRAGRPRRSLRRQLLRRARGRGRTNSRTGCAAARTAARSTTATRPRSRCAEATAVVAARRGVRCRSKPSTPASRRRRGRTSRARSCAPRNTRPSR